jgi:hypothetical protein
VRGRWRVAALTAVLLLSAQIPAARVTRASSDAVTVVVLDSEAGEPTGIGRAHTFAGSEIHVTGGGPGAVYLSLDNGSFTHVLELQSSSPFVVGPYENASWNGDPHLYITLGSTISTGLGRFDVLEAPVLDAEDHLQSFAADFSLFTSSGGPVLYGQIRINSTVPVKALDLDVPGSDDLDMGLGTVMVANAPTAIMVSNVGNQPVSLDGITIGGTNPASFLASWTCPPSLPAGATCSISLTYRPATSGMNDARVTIATDALRWGRWFHPYGTATFADAPNMSPATAIVIGSLPFGHGGNLNPDASAGSWISCPGDYGSLWYRYTSPIRKRVELDPTGSTSPVAVMVMAGSSTIQPFACGQNAPVTFTAEPNVTYWIRLQRKYDSGAQGTGLVLQARIGAPDVTVQASGIGVSASTFYPYVDAYRDTVLLRGSRSEKASVAISIYGPTGGKVRALSVGAASGTWSVAWNGRTASGVALKAGKYKVVQTVTDVWGNKLSSTVYTTISWKRLYTYTYSKTLDAGAYAAYGKVGTGSISKAGSSYTGGVRLSTGTGGGSAAVGFAFTAPAATIYKTVTFQVLGRGAFVAGGFPETGVQKWTECATWSDSCVDAWGAAPRVYGWAGVRVTGTGHVSSGRAVRGYLRVWTYGAGLATWIDARDVKITIVYGILR